MNLSSRTTGAPEAALPSKALDRREFIQRAALGTAALGLGLSGEARAQSAVKPPSRPEGVSVLNPRGRAPVGLIIDDSTCLVNLNRFAMPQFDAAFDGKNVHYHQNWREWPAEIPDAFVRKFGEWSAAHGIRGKYSIVPFPACVGRMDRLLPGWTRRELEASLELVRSVMMPNWDIHPEMVTHTRVIDLKTGQPYPDASLAFMENWDWTTGRSTSEIADYLAYALRILKNAGLSCEGITTPGGFGNQARPQLAQATLESVRDVFKVDIAHYFRDLFDTGKQSVAPLVQNATGLDTADPRCVVHTIGCTGDWTGGWDCTPPEGVDKFITADGQKGRVVDVITRGEPALMVAHWTGIYWNGRELGFQIFQEVVKRLHARFDNLIWMKLSEVSRYWAARELTRIECTSDSLKLQAPFACPDFTIQWPAPPNRTPKFRTAATKTELKEVTSPLKLAAGTWHRSGEQVSACFAMPKGDSTIEW